MKFFSRFLLLFMLCSVSIWDSAQANENAAPLTLNLEITPIIRPSDAIVVKGSVVSGLQESFTGLKVGYTILGKSTTIDYNNTISPNNAFSFIIPTTAKLGNKESTECIVWVEHDGTRITKSAKVTAGNVVMVSEEMTGTWCGWCVRGIVAMKNMYDKYPDSFIGIAVHGGDIFEIRDYINHVADITTTSGYPNSVNNRKLSGNPEYFQNYYNSIQDEPLQSIVSLKATIEDNSVTVKSSSIFAKSTYSHNYCVSYVVIENDVWEADNADYFQSNKYAGGVNGPMGGFENLPSKISDFHFDDVARAVIGDVKGIDDSLPESVIAGKEYTHTQSFTLPRNILNPKNVEIVALVVNKSNKEIIGAAKTKLESGAGVSSLEAENPTIVARYSIDGRLLSNPEQGINILKMSDGTARKVIVQ